MEKLKQNKCYSTVNSGRAASLIRFSFVWFACECVQQISRYFCPRGDIDDNQNKWMDECSGIQRTMAKCSIHFCTQFDWHANSAAFVCSLKKGLNEFHKKGNTNRVIVFNSTSSSSTLFFSNCLFDFPANTFAYELVLNTLSQSAHRHHTPHNQLHIHTQQLMMFENNTKWTWNL